MAKEPIICPNCNTRYNLTDPEVGDRYRCPDCNQMITVTKLPTYTITITNSSVGESDNAFSDLGNSFTLNIFG